MLIKKRIFKSIVWFYLKTLTMQIYKFNLNLTNINIEIIEKS